MTAIVGIEAAGEVWIGGDAAAIDESYDSEARRDPKVFINGPCLMGYTTSFRMGQLLEHVLKVPAHPSGVDDMAWLVGDFMDSVRKCFAEGGFLVTKSETSDTGGQFLLGYRGHLYAVHSDFQVGRSRAGYAAVGCGAPYALGALYASRGYGFTSEGRLRISLEAAARHNAAIRKPFTILTAP